MTKYPTRSNLKRERLVLACGWPGHTSSCREAQWLKRTLARHTVTAVKKHRETDASAQLRLFIQDGTSACETASPMVKVGLLTSVNLI